MRDANRPRRMRPWVWLLVVASLVLSPIASGQEGAQSVDRTTVTMWIPAVGQREDGTLFGVASSMTVTMQRPGTGEVFLSTKPQAQLDMQGSARLAVETAGEI